MPSGAFTSQSHAITIASFNVYLCAIAYVVCPWRVPGVCMLATHLARVWRLVDSAVMADFLRY